MNKKIKIAFLTLLFSIASIASAIVPAVTDFSANNYFSRMKLRYLMLRGEKRVKYSEKQKLKDNKLQDLITTLGIVAGVYYTGKFSLGQLKRLVSQKEKPNKPIENQNQNENKPATLEDELNYLKWAIEEKNHNEPLAINLEKVELKNTILTITIAKNATYKDGKFTSSATLQNILNSFSEISPLLVNKIKFYQTLKDVNQVTLICSDAGQINTKFENKALVYDPALNNNNTIQQLIEINNIKVEKKKGGWEAILENLLFKKVSPNSIYEDATIRDGTIYIEIPKNATASFSFLPVAINDPELPSKVEPLAVYLFNHEFSKHPEFQRKLECNSFIKSEDTILSMLNGVLESANNASEIKKLKITFSGEHKSLTYQVNNNKFERVKS